MHIHQQQSVSIRFGLTLIELMISTVITSIIVVAVVAVATTVQKTSEYSDEHNTVVQHARVAIDRINRTIQGAATNTDSPGVVALADVVDSYSFPDTLVIWREDSNADDKPQFNELTVFCPNPDVPNQLVELIFTDVNDSPSFNDPTSLKAALDPLITAALPTAIVLTERLRTASANGSQRGCVRFDVRVIPTVNQYSEYQAGNIAWEDLPWVQGIYGSTAGLRQSWVRYEIQLLPDEQLTTDIRGQQSIPFFGSSALYDQLSK